MLTPEVDMSNYDKLGCLHDLFITQAKKTPNDTAVVSYDGTKTTFSELDKLTDILADSLRRLGVAVDTSVGILMERSLEYVVSVIGILKAGGGYLPLETSYPPSLLASVIEDATPVVICTKNVFKPRLAKNNVPLILMDSGWELILKNKVKGLPPHPPVKVELDDLGYVVYSSGTTGKPKGIKCPHRGSVFAYTWRHLAYPYQHDDREACNVFFVWEMLRPISKGIPLYIIPDDVIYDPPKLVAFLEASRITRILFTPSLLQAVLECKGLNLKEDLKSLRIIIFCGEVVTIALRNRVSKTLPWVQQLNLYSISECNDVACADISCTSNCIEPRQFCPVGKLFPGVHMIVLDENLNTKATGEPGEIFVGGPTLAIGYLNRPELNQEKFITRPKNVDTKVGDRLYRTGDWGYVLSDGSFEICGRCDSMVKIRGYTVELQAVETRLLEIHNISACCVQAIGEEGTDKIIVAFVVLQPNVQISYRELRNQLKKKLAFYMIPSRFIFLDRIPVVEASGKLDKKALASLFTESRKQMDTLEISNCDNNGQELPINETELQVAKIWCRLLNISSLDINENFFELGGHSLLAAHLASEVNEQFNTNLNTTIIYKFPTVSSLTRVINDPKAIQQDNIDLSSEVHKLVLQPSKIDAQLRSFWKSVKYNIGKFTKGNVLLTGATGFLGTYILQELLVNTQVTVFCLVRTKPDKDALQRILESRRKFGMNDLLTEDRVITIRGDIGLENFGLSEDEYSSLSFDIDWIIHAAAHVNLILPYSGLYSSNVLGTYNIINFAITNKLKSLNYISTDAVFPSGLKDIREDTDMSLYPSELRTGYSQTKWVAEQLVVKASEYGLPTVILRCGNISGATNYDSWNPVDFTLYIIKGVVLTKTAPNIDWQIELTPVDFVSSVIVSIGLKISDTAGQKYHLINTNTLDCRALWELMQDTGYKIQIVSYNTWVKNVLDESKNNTQLEPLSHLLFHLVGSKEYFSSENTYKQDKLRQFLQTEGLTYPAVNVKLFQCYLTSLVKTEAISSPLKKAEVIRNKFIDNRVILVTGASAGIGKGIAYKLAMNGAKVVFAARRMDRLLAITEELRSIGATVSAVEMDVCNKKSVERAVKYIESNIGPIDILVNNAGMLYYQFMENCELDDWHQMVNVNIGGVLNCLAAVLGNMVTRKTGHIINISSDGGRKAFPGLAVYCATKYFIECLSRTMRAEIAASGVKVTSIQPGDVLSELYNHRMDRKALKTFAYYDRYPLLKPEDIGEAVLYALSQPPYCAINEILLEPQLAPI